MLSMYQFWSAILEFRTAGPLAVESMLIGRPVDGDRWRGETNNWLWVFQGGRIWQQAAAVLGFQSAPSNRVRSSFLEGQNGWKPGWASDSHAIGVGAV
jgi:hypothetical protein